MENANYIVAMFNDLLWRFSKARKIKWPSFLQTKESTLLKRKSIKSFALNGWKLSYLWLIESILGVQYLRYSIINLWLLVLNFATLRRWFVFFKVQVMRFLVVLFEKWVKFLVSYLIEWERIDVFSDLKNIFVKLNISNLFICWTSSSSVVFVYPSLQTCERIWQVLQYCWKIFRLVWRPVALLENKTTLSA